MTEAEWLACTDYKQMLNAGRHRISERKLRLFSCGIARRVWKSLTLKPVRTAVLTSERYADGLATELELDFFHQQGVARWAQMTQRTSLRKPDLRMRLARMAQAVDSSAPGPFQFRSEPSLSDEEDHYVVALKPCLLRCVAGNPFRPVAFDPHWRTADVTALARGIYDDRAFDRLPLLADALMDAGCDHDDVLAHCRSDGPHVRGCWVVDFVLGKEERSPDAQRSDYG